MVRERKKEKKGCRRTNGLRAPYLKNGIVLDFYRLCAQRAVETKEQGAEQIIGANSDGSLGHL